jgi:hypothetical protein
MARTRRYDGSEEFIKGSERMRAVHRGRNYLVTIVAEAADPFKAGSATVLLFEGVFGRKQTAVNAMIDFLEVFPGIEISYLDEETSVTDPWFRDWDYRHYFGVD